MTIDEAVKHCLETAEQLEERANAPYKCEDSELQDNACRECAADHRQLAEWLTELKEAKLLLKSATNVLSMFIPCDEDYNCSECIKQRQHCDYDDSFKWRYLDEALKLIGGETGEKP